jgi:hypothetical protein
MDGVEFPHIFSGANGELVIFYTLSNKIIAYCGDSHVEIVTGSIIFSEKSRNRMLLCSSCLHWR